MTGNNNFESAKDVYFKNIALPNPNSGYSRGLRITSKPNKGKEPTWDANSKYARAARLGLCFHCLREDTDPHHRPKHRSFGFCDECMAAMSSGIEGLELRKKLEVEEWFGDEQ
jgi:hypothetical protein